jgi:phosphoglycerol transferase
MIEIEVSRPKALVFSTLANVLTYLLAATLSLICAFVVLNLSSPELLHVPILYSKDEVFYAMTIKSMLTTGWYLTNPMIGAPDGHNLVDFPTPEGLNYLLIKFISLFSSEWAVINNIFYLCTFPLIALTSLFVMRQIGLQTPFALTASILFALLPYHFMRGTEHLFLCAYYTPPLAIWLSVLIYKDQLFPKIETSHSMKRKKLYRFSPYILACILLGSTGVYYAYFGCFFLLISGLITSHRIKHLRPLGYAFLLISLITVSMVANLLPTLIYHFKNGPNPHAYHRQIVETELYGLKIAQLLLPVDGDRIQILAKIKKKYNDHNICNENTTATLGTIGSLGFLVLLSYLLKRKKDDVSTIEALSHFTLSGLLLATVGGISSIITVILYREIRGYNRISVYLAFFALAAFFLVLQKILAKKQPNTTRALCILLAAFGIFNQTSANFSLSKTFKARKHAFLQDRAFFSHIDQQLPPKSMIFQLPYLPFPEGDHPRLISYDHFRAPLHSNLQKWSFGALKGRPTDLWQRAVSQMPLTEMLKELAYMGFSGLYLNRNAYADQGSEIETLLTQLLQELPFENETASFWDLRSFIHNIKSSQSNEEWNFHAEQAKKQIFR